MAEDPVGDVKHLSACRREIAEAVGRYADGWSTTEGAIVTNLSVVADVACPDGSHRLLQIHATGDGEVDVPTWASIGMLTVAIDDLR